MDDRAIPNTEPDAADSQVGFEEGEVIGSYRIGRRLGHGGMGQVFFAQHTVLGRDVALKLLHAKYATDRTAVRRFFREAQAASRINHPNVVAITDFIEDEDRCCYIMEYLDGEPLSTRIARERLTIPEVLDIAIQIADGLTALFESGVIHRDLKPGNIFLLKVRRDEVQVKLLDFGLVKLLESARPETRTPESNPTVMLGTPEYMSPEQIRTPANIDHRSDLFSLGVVLYELVTGTRPFGGQSIGDLLVQILKEQPAPPSARGADLPPRLERLIMRCLEKAAARRPASPAEVLNELLSISREQQQPTIVPRRRWRWPVLALVAVVCAGIAVGVWRGIVARREPAKPPESPIAALREPRHKVEHRPRERKSWGPARAGMALFHLDAIRTGESSSAAVRFRTGSQLEVEERSVVLVEEPGDRPGGVPMVRLRAGTVRSRVVQGKPLDIYTPDGRLARVVARGKGPVAVRLQAGERGQLRLAVLKGTARVSSGARKIDIEPNRRVDIEHGRFSSATALVPFPELLSPTVDALLPGPAVTLRWKGVPGARAYHVQVADRVGFESKLVDRTTPDTELKVELPVGRFFWRISSVDTTGYEGEFGFARRCAIAAAPTAPVLLPEDGTALEQGPVTFRWSARCEPCLLQVARRRSLRGAVLKRKVRGSRTVVQQLKPAMYYWGLFQLGPGGKRTPLHQRPHRLLLRAPRPPRLQLPDIQWDRRGKRVRGRRP